MQPISFNHDSGTNSSAALTASEQDFSKMSPLDRSGEEGIGSEARQPVKQAVAELGHSKEGESVEQEGQGLDKPSAAMVEEGREPSAHHDVGIYAEFEDSLHAEVEDLSTVHYGWFAVSRGYSGRKS